MLVTKTEYFRTNEYVFLIQKGATPPWKKDKGGGGRASVERGEGPQGRKGGKLTLSILFVSGWEIVVAKPGEGMRECFVHYSPECEVWRGFVWAPWKLNRRQS